MSDFAPEGRAGAPTGFIAVSRLSRPVRARVIPGWLRLMVILGISLALWAVIIAGLHWLFTLCAAAVVSIAG